MITWIKLEPVPLKEKFFVGNFSQVDAMVSQIKRSYFIPKGIQIENGGDCVLIGSDDNDEIHKAAMDNIMLNYPKEWDLESESNSKYVQERASVDFIPMRFSALKLTEFLKGFASSLNLFKPEELSEISDKHTNDFYFDVFLNPQGLKEKERALKEKREQEFLKEKEEREKEIQEVIDEKERDFSLRSPKIPRSLLFKKPTDAPEEPEILEDEDEEEKKQELDESGAPPKPIQLVPKPKPKVIEIPFDVAAEVGHKSDLDFLDFNHFYTWMLDNSFIISRLKPGFYISGCRSIAIPLTEYMNSFENKNISHNLKLYCTEKELVDKNIFLMLFR